MNQTQTERYNNDVILHIIVILSILATLFIQFILESWHSNQSNMKSQQSLGTPHSPTRKDKSQPTLPSASTTLKTEMDGRTSSGKVSGIQSQPLKSAKNGSSTRSVSRRTRTKRNPTTRTVGSQSLV
jgi:hypothetical protein